MQLKVGSYLNLANMSTLIFITTLMFLHEVFTVSAFLYLALHTSYCCVWLMKHYIFPNPSFERDVSIMDLVFSIPILFGTYWLLPYMCIVMMKDEPIRGYQIFGSVVSFFVGMATMMVSDAENYYLLEHSPDDISKIGVNRLVVAPNIIGEFFLYCSFAILSQSPPALLLLLGLWVMIYHPVNTMKANNLVHYLQNWEHWKRSTGMFFPDLIHVTAALSTSPQSVALEEETTTDSTQSPSEESSEEKGYEDDAEDTPYEKSGDKSHYPFSAHDQKEDEGEEEDEPTLFDGKGPTSGLHQRPSPMHHSRRGSAVKKP